MNEGIKGAKGTNCIVDHDTNISDVNGVADHVLKENSEVKQLNAIIPIGQKNGRPPLNTLLMIQAYLVECSGCSGTGILQSMATSWCLRCFKYKIVCDCIDDGDNVILCSKCKGFGYVPELYRPDWFKLYKYHNKSTKVRIHNAKKIN